MPQRDYLSFERTPRSEEVQEDPPKQIEKLEHPAFFARFGRSGQEHPFFVAIDILRALERS